MPGKDFFKRVYIKICRYVFGKKFLPVMKGPLKGYLWSTASSYEYILGKYEDPETVKTFLSWLKPDTVFYDLGANAGYYALLANRVISSGRIYSFEPSPAAQEIFQHHIKRNHLFIRNNNIRLLPYALSGRRPARHAPSGRQGPEKLPEALAQGRESMVKQLGG